MKLESEIQARLIRDLRIRYPKSIVIKNDPTYIQGIPDILILFKNKWAALEIKRNKSAKKRPNQDFYVNKMNDMSYASYISPETKNEVLSELDKFFENGRSKNEF